MCASKKDQPQDLEIFVIIVELSKKIAWPRDAFVIFEMIYPRKGGPGQSQSSLSTST